MVSSTRLVSFFLIFSCAHLLGAPSAQSAERSRSTTPTKTRVVVLGSGITGLCLGALLSQKGHVVTVLEMHPTLIGGHARTLNIDGFDVSAGTQYVWNFGPEQAGFQVLERLGLAEQVPFDLMDPDGFDEIVVDGESINVPIGLDRYRKVLIAEFPDEGVHIDLFFSHIVDLFEAARYVNDTGLYLANRPAILLGLLCTREVSVRAKLRMLLLSNSSLDDLFDICSLSAKVRRVLYGQAGLFAENVDSVSVAAYAAAIGYYHTGPRFPRYGFRSVIDGLCDVIRAGGGAVLNGKKVVELDIRERRVRNVLCEDGSVYPCDTVISTLSPRLTAMVVPGADLSQLDYEPSNSALSCYLVVSDYPSISERLAGKNIWWHAWPGPLDFDNPDMTDRPRMLAITSPSAIGTVSNMAPGDESLVLFAPGNFKQAQAAHRAGRHNLLKRQIADAVLGVLDEEVFPEIRGHVRAIHVLTPWDLREQLGAERGNIYGKRLDVFNLFYATTYTPYATNLYLANATTGLPGVATAFQTANLMCGEDDEGVVGPIEIILRALWHCYWPSR